jgi:hypothetical protein
MRVPVPHPVFVALDVLAQAARAYAAYQRLKAVEAAVGAHGRACAALEHATSAWHAERMRAYEAVEELARQGRVSEARAALQWLKEALANEKGYVMEREREIQAILGRCRE